MGDIRVEMSGNLTGEPEIRFTPSGAPVANFRVACTHRKYNPQTQRMEDDKTTFLNVVIWRTLAENVVESLHKGTAVIVTGRLEQREYETRDGEKRTVYDVVDATIGVDLQWATAQVTRNQRNGAANAGGGGDSTPAAARPAPATGGPGLMDEPPF